MKCYHRQISMIDTCASSHDALNEMTDLVCAHSAGYITCISLISTCVLRHFSARHLYSGIFIVCNNVIIMLFSMAQVYETN
jgi:hypothetical protein